ncbi:MAG: glucosaminidase domain-containing protein [Rhodospirillales bacterium]|nr:glucosaminidase domain-containing protein [Rhodospirillales bacterium]
MERNRNIIPARTGRAGKGRARLWFEGVAILGLVASVAALYAASLTNSFSRGLDLPREVLVARGLLPPALPDDEERPNAQQLSQALAGLGYDLGEVGKGDREVPRLFLASLPADMDDIDEPAQRKALFLRGLLPLVLKANETILAERRLLLDLAQRIARGDRPTPAEGDWLVDLGRRYEVEDLDFLTLFNRVDVIPVSLALAQAAEESGWGTSRFARDGNALFGQGTINEEKGIVPTDRQGKGPYAVRRFGSLAEAVRAYTLNLNTHKAYRDFRQARWRAREEGKDPEGLELAGTLAGYSARGDGYVETIRTIIRKNGLAALDDARLSRRNLPQPMYR